MIHSSRSACSIVSLLTAFAPLLIACGDPEVPKADVEAEAMRSLTAAVGKPSPPITCPGNLKAKVGTKITCSAPIDGKTYDVNVTVSTVEGSTAHFSVEVADKPRS